MEKYDLLPSLGDSFVSLFEALVFVRFSNTWKGFLETPASMLLDLK